MQQLLSGHVTSSIVLWRRGTAAGEPPRSDKSALCNRRRTPSLEGEEKEEEEHLSSVHLEEFLWVELVI